MLVQTLALPPLVKVGGPLAQLSLRNSGAAGFDDSHEPRRLAADDLRHLRIISGASLAASLAIVAWFCVVGLGAAASLLVGDAAGSETWYLRGKEIFPQPGCLSSSADKALRWWLVLGYVPAGFTLATFLHLCVLSQILAVQFVNRDIENVTKRLEFDRKLTSLADDVFVAAMEADAETTLSNLIAKDQEAWQDRVHTPLLSLVRQTLPLLSAWGPAIAAQITGCKCRTDSSEG